MSFHDYWNHYYDRPCQVCKEQIDMSDGYEGSGECSYCQKLLCEDCQYNVSKCHVCKKKLDLDEDIVCEDCMLSCDDCPDCNFHPSCQDEHQETCNARGRAHRAVAFATEAVEYKTSEVRALKRQLAEAEEELQAAKKSKKEAEENFKSLPTET